MQAALDGTGDVYKRQSLERVLERAIEDDDWRSRVSAGIAERSRRHVSMDAFAERMLTHISRVVAWRATWEMKGHSWPPPESLLEELAELSESDLSKRLAEL